MDEEGLRILDQALLDLDLSDRDDADDASFEPIMSNVRGSSSTDSTDSVLTAITEDERDQLLEDVNKSLPREPIITISSSDDEKSNKSDKKSVDKPPAEREEEEEEPQAGTSKSAMAFHSDEDALRIDFDDPEVRDPVMKSFFSQVLNPFTIQVKAQQREFARKLASKKPVPTTSKPAAADWEETKEILYKRANLDIPTKHRKQRAEFSVEKLDFTKEMAEDKYKEAVGSCAKLAAGAAMLAVRLVKDLRDECHLIGHSVRGLQDQVRKICLIRRRMQCFLYVSSPPPFRSPQSGESSLAATSMFQRARRSPSTQGSTLYSRVSFLWTVSRR